MYSRVKQLENYENSCSPEQHSPLTMNEAVQHGSYLGWLHPVQLRSLWLHHQSRECQSASPATTEAARHVLATDLSPTSAASQGPSPIQRTSVITRINTEQNTIKRYVTLPVNNFIAITSNSSFLRYSVLQQAVTASINNA